MSDDIRELVAGICTLSSTLIHNNNNNLMNTTHNNSSQRHQLSISVLNNIDTFNGKQGHKLDDWLADVENAAAIVEEDEVVVAKGKARGLARDLIKEHENQPWHHIKEQLRNCLNNASIHTYTSRFMEIQQKDSETLTVYIHRFKKEAKHCDFDSHPAKIRIFLKGLTNSSRIAPSVYEKGPTTIEDAISIVEKISSAQPIAASFSQNHQISMMKRGCNEHHTPEHHHTQNHHQLMKPRLLKLWTIRTPKVHLSTHNLRWMQPMWSHLQTLLGEDTTIRDIQPTRQSSSMRQMSVTPLIPGTST